MTKEEAIKWLENLKSDIGKMQFQALWGYEQAMDEIIGLLSAKPSKSTDQNVADVPIDDLVSRAEVLALINTAMFSIDNREMQDYIFNGLRREVHNLPSADRPTLKQTDTLIIADALRYLIQDTERHEIDRTRAEKLREQILQYGASMCSSADRPQVNSAEWVAEKERDFEELNRQNEDSKPQPYIPEASTERVVHCKDCIYSYSRQPEGEKLFVCENRFGMSGWVREDEFCSSGSL